MTWSQIAEIIMAVLAGLFIHALMVRMYTFRSMYQQEVERSRELMQQALVIQGAYAQMTNEYQHWKRVVQNVSERPVIANLTDRQAQELTHALISYCEAMRNPEKMN